MGFIVYIALLCKKKKPVGTIYIIQYRYICLECVLTVKKRTNWRHVFKLIIYNNTLTVNIVSGNYYYNIYCCLLFFGVFIVVVSPRETSLKKYYYVYANRIFIIIYIIIIIIITSYCSQSYHTRHITHVYLFSTTIYNI